MESLSNAIALNSEILFEIDRVLNRRLEGWIDAETAIKLIENIMIQYTIQSNDGED